jgi:hypothetical protein
MRPPITKKLAALALCASVALLFLPASAVSAGQRNETHKPPYKKGVQGGDDSNYIYADPSSGQEMVVRAYTGYNPFTCGSSHGGYVSLRLPVKVRSPIASIEVDYDNALVDPYSFVTVTIKDPKINRYIGSKDVHGPLDGGGAIKVPIDLGTARVGSTVVVEFGLEVPSACPNVEVAEAQFSQVVVHHA